MIFLAAQTSILREDGSKAELKFSENMCVELSPTSATGKAVGVEAPDPRGTPVLEVPGLLQKQFRPVGSQSTCCTIT